MIKLVVGLQVAVLVLLVAVVVMLVPLYRTYYGEFQHQAPAETGAPYNPAPCPTSQGC